MRTQTSLHGFAEAAALEHPEFNLHTREDSIRNGNPAEAMRHLVRFRDFKKYLFHGPRYSGVWMPKDLRRGQIVRCNLPTDYDGNGDVTLSPRNCFVLGLDICKETFAPLAVRLARFSYNVDNRHDQEPVFSILDENDRRMIYGLKRDSVLRTISPIDIVPMNSLYWGNFVDVCGIVEKQYLEQFERYMEDGYSARQGIPFRNWAEMPENASYFVPSADPSFIHADYDFVLDDKIGTDIYELSDKRMDEICLALEDAQLEQTIDRSDFLDTEKDLKGHLSAKRRQEERDVKKAVKDLMRFHNSLSREALSFIKKDVAARVALHDEARARDMADATDPHIKDYKPVMLADLPSFETLIAEAHAKWADTIDAGRIAREAVENQQLDNGSLKSLIDFGIGGLVREPSIDIPEHLWQGRYHMLRIPDLLDPENMDALTNRPCALWRAWVRPNGNGELKLSHMELLPCTRSQSHNFRFKMKVKPLDTTVPVPSFLIIERPVLVEVSSMNFQPNQPLIGTFYELLPHQVQDIAVKRQIAEEQNAVRYFGYQPEDLPADCIEIPLPQPPEERIRAKLASWGAARFVTSDERRPSRSIKPQPDTGKTPLQRDLI